MKINIIKVILIILISGSFLSCSGQMKADKKSADVKNLTLGKLVTKLDNQIWSIFQDRKGNFWFGSNGEGLYHFDGNKLNLFTTNDNLVSNTIRGIQEDNKGNIYVETPKGVSKFDGINFTTLKAIRSPNNEWKLEQNDLWFNCNGNANHVYRFDGENLYELQLPRKNIEKKLGIDENEISYSPYTVFGISKDKSGNLWLGTVLAGAFRFDGNSFLWIGEKELSRLSDGREPGVRSILEDNDGNMWLSNFYSKYKIKSDSTQSYEKIKAVELSENSIEDKLLYFNSGLEDKNGNLWMTTYGGGIWHYDGESLSNSKIHNGIENVLLITIYKDNNGTIWLGTNNDGVYKSNGKSFKKFEINK